MTRRGNQAQDLPHNVYAVTLRDEPDRNGEYVTISSWDDPRKEKWYVVEAASGSDYSGGLLSKSSHQVLAEILDKEHPRDSKPVVWGYTSGPHGSYGIVVRYELLGKESREAIDALTDYPILDESHYSALKNEAQEEAWERWAQRDFESAIEKHFDLDEFPEDVDSYELFRNASDVANVYWEDTNEGVHIDVDRVSREAIDLIEGDAELSKQFGVSRSDNPRRRRKKRSSKKRRAAKSKKGRKTMGRRKNPNQPAAVIVGRSPRATNPVSVVIAADGRPLEIFDGWPPIELPGVEIDISSADRKRLLEGRVANPWIEDPVWSTAIGAGLGALLGRLPGALVAVAGGPAAGGAMALGGVVGGALGGYTGAPKDRKGRGAWGGGIGGLFGPLGALAGGAIAGRKPGRKSNPAPNTPGLETVRTPALKNKLLK